MFKVYTGGCDNRLASPGFTTCGYLSGFFPSIFAFHKNEVPSEALSLSNSSVLSV